jgi:hypothetical protein
VYSASALRAVRNRLRVTMRNHAAAVLRPF